MQRLLLIAGLLAVGGCASDQAARTDGSEDAPRIIQETRLPLNTEQGSLDGSGNWSLRAEIEHPRLRCATYEAGIRVGRGDSSCDNVEWLTAPQFGPERRQCNQATVVHTGSGSFALPQAEVGSINCVGVVLRCSGAC